MAGHPQTRTPTTHTHPSSKMATLLVALLLSLLAPLSAAASEGWGPYSWVPFNDAFAVAKTQDKPVMLVIHKSWCGACKSLRPRFAESAAIKSESEHFVMVNVVDDEEPKGEQYSPDGGYIPRVLFLDADGNVLSDVVNVGGNDKYKYYYSDGDSIARSMAMARKRVARRAAEEDL